MNVKKGALDPSTVVAPPITWILPRTSTATAAPSLPGSGASAFQESAAGSYSQTSSMGCQAAPIGTGLFSGATKPPHT